MKIRKINATPSTNSSLKALVRQSADKEEMVLVAKHQTAGRGQRGTVWQSQDGKSLTFSVFKNNLSVSVSDNFYIAMAVALAVKSALEGFSIPDLYVKWPNDILSANKKIGGILIENTIQDTLVQSAFIGIGINVNETKFNALPRATSMQLLTGTNFEVTSVLYQVLGQLEFYMRQVTPENFKVLKETYLSSLFCYEKVCVFKKKSGELANGIIKDISNSGKLVVEWEDQSRAAYALKEIEMLY